MKERPIIFSGPMVRAILDGKKTQTRRVLKPQPKNYIIQSSNDGLFYDAESINAGKLVKCPFGAIGDRLWVKETWADVNSEEGPALLYRDGCMRSWHEWCVERGVDYGAGPPMNYDKYPGDYVMWWSDLWRGEPDHKWTSPLFMPRWASRLTLEITDVRVQRVQGITLKDVAAEGVEPNNEQGWDCIDGYRMLWDSLNAKRGFTWDSNPWVWALTFRRLTND